MEEVSSGDEDMTRAMEDLEIYRHSLVVSLETRWQIANKMGVKVKYASPELFVALNTQHSPQCSSCLENQVDVGNTVHDSVLYFTGRAVLSAMQHRGSGRTAGGYLAGEANIPGKGLEDLRQVDVHESSMAFPFEDSRTFNGETIAMCQHPKMKQVFATVDTENLIQIWSWKGTESEYPGKRAVKPWCHIPGSRRETVLKVSFLSEAPQRIMDYQGTVLLKVSLPHGRNWLYISAVSVYSCAQVSECVKEVLFFEPLMEGIRKTGVDINIFKLAHSGRMFVIGGTGILQFWSIYDSSKDLRLSCAVDLLEFSKLRRRTFLTCLCLPAPVDSQAADSMISMTDWVVLGDSEGQLFGFAVNCTELGKVELIVEQSGRLYGCEHTERAHIASILDAYGDRPECHDLVEQEQEGQREVHQGLDILRGLEQSLADRDRQLEEVKACLRAVELKMRAKDSDPPHLFPEASEGLPKKPGGVESKLVSGSFDTVDEAERKIPSSDEEEEQVSEEEQKVSEVMLREVGPVDTEAPAEPSPKAAAAPAPSEVPAAFAAVPAIAVPVVKAPALGPVLKDIREWEVINIHKSIVATGRTRTMEETMVFHSTSQDVAQAILAGGLGLRVSEDGFQGGGLFFSTFPPVDDQLLAEHSDKKYKDVFDEFRVRQLERNYGTDTTGRERKVDVVLIYFVLSEFIEEVDPQHRPGAVFISKAKFSLHSTASDGFKYLPLEKIVRAYVIGGDQ